MDAPKRTTQKENVIVVYLGEQLESIIHYERRSNTTTIYDCKGATADDIAERIATPEPALSDKP